MFRNRIMCAALLVMLVLGGTITAASDNSMDDIEIEAGTNVLNIDVLNFDTDKFFGIAPSVRASYSNDDSDDFWYSAEAFAYIFNVNVFSSSIFTVSPYIKLSGTMDWASDLMEDSSFFADPQIVFQKWSNEYRLWNTVNGGFAIDNKTETENPDSSWIPKLYEGYEASVSLRPEFVYYFDSKWKYTDNRFLISGTYGDGLSEDMWYKAGATLDTFLYYWNNNEFNFTPDLYLYPWAQMWYQLDEESFVTAYAGFEFRQIFKNFNMSYNLSGTYNYLIDDLKLYGGLDVYGSTGSFLSDLQVRIGAEYKIK